MNDLDAVSYWTSVLREVLENHELYCQMRGLRSLVSFR